MGKGLGKKTLNRKEEKWNLGRSNFTGIITRNLVV